MVTNPAYGGLNRENLYSLSPFVPDDLVSGVRSVDPSRVILLILHIRAESDNYGMTLLLLPAFRHGPAVVHRLSPDFKRSRNYVHHREPLSQK